MDVKKRRLIMTTNISPIAFQDKANIFSTKTLPSIGKKIALVAISVLFSSLFFFLTGKSLLWLASRMISTHSFTKIIPYLQKTGSLLIKGSEYLLLAITVPLYSTFYIFPKWIIQVALPMAGKMLTKWGLYTLQKILIPSASFLAKKIDSLGNWILHRIQWTFTHILRPLGHHVVQIWNFIQPKLCSLASKILLGFRWIATQIKHLLTPLFQCIRTWARYVGNLIRFTIDHILSPLWKQFLTCVTSLASSILRNILKPIIRGISYLFHKLVIFTQNVGEKLYGFSKWTFTHILHPLLRATIKCSQAAGRFLQKNLLIPLKKTIRFVFDRSMELTLYVEKKIRQFSSWVFHHILEPISTKLASCVKWMFQKIIAPAATQIGKKTKEATLWLYNRCIVPIAKAIFYFLRITWKSLYNICHWLYSHVILPIANVSSAITCKIAKSMQKLVYFIIKTSQTLMTATKESAINFYKKLIAIFDKPAITTRVAIH
jgi:hypothetical protein